MSNMFLGFIALALEFGYGCSLNTALYRDILKYTEKNKRRRHTYRSTLCYIP